MVRKIFDKIKQEHKEIEDLKRYRSIKEIEIASAKEIDQQLFSDLSSLSKRIEEKEKSLAQSNDELILGIISELETLADAIKRMKK